MSAQVHKIPSIVISLVARSQQVTGKNPQIHFKVIRNVNQVWKLLTS